MPVRHKHSLATSVCSYLIELPVEQHAMRTKSVVYFTDVFTAQGSDVSVVFGIGVKVFSVSLLT